MRRIFGDEVVSSSSVRRAAELSAAAVAGCDMAGRPVGAANQAIPEPDEPHLRLWQALTAMREHRGDGHVDQLIAAGVSPSEALVLQAATGRSPEDGLRSNRGWSADEWSEAAASLAARGLVDDETRITGVGAAMRQAIEDGTDRLADPIAAAIGEDRADELVALLRPLAEAVMGSGAVPGHNNMGVPWPPGQSGGNSGRSLSGHSGPRRYPMRQYLLSIYQPDGPPPASVDLEEIGRNLATLREELRQAGAWVFADGLFPATTATVVLVRQGDVLVTDGPYVEGKEHLGGLTIIEADDLDAALEWGRKLSEATTLPVEVRPFQGGAEIH